MRGGSVLRVRVQPGASRTGVAGVRGDAIALRVGARAIEGAANREVLALLARALGIGVSALELATGEHARAKLIRVRGLDPNVVRARLVPRPRV